MALTAPDPHVVSLTYAFASSASDRYDHAAAMDFTEEGFDFELRGGVLTVRPKAHFATSEEARAAVEPYLASWAARARLELNGRKIQFNFKTAEIEDRSPSGALARLAVEHVGLLTMDAEIVIGHGNYPPQPVGFRTDPVLDAILDRLSQFEARGLTLTDLANWTVTKVEEEFGDGPKGTRRQRAAAHLRLDYDILSNLGRLASQNDPQIGRKAKGPVKPLTSNERAWMREAVKIIALQIGAMNAGLAPKLVTMAEIPLIP